MVGMGRLAWCCAAVRRCGAAVLRLLVEADGAKQVEALPGLVPGLVVCFVWLLAVCVDFPPSYSLTGLPGAQCWSEQGAG